MDVFLNFFLVEFPQPLRLFLHFFSGSLHFLQPIIFLLSQFSPKPINLPITFDDLFFIQLDLSLTSWAILSWPLFEIRCLVVMMGRVQLLLITAVVVVVMDRLNGVSWHSVLQGFLDLTYRPWTLACYDFSLIAISPIGCGSACFIVKNFFPVLFREYIYESSRWCLLMRNGVLLVMFILVWVTLGVSCLLAFRTLLIPNIISLVSAQFKCKLLFVICDVIVRH